MDREQEAKDFIKAVKRGTEPFDDVAPKAFLNEQIHIVVAWALKRIDELEARIEKLERN